MGGKKTFKSLVTEPRVTGGGSDKEGEALEFCKRCERRARKHDPKASFVVQI